MKVKKPKQAKYPAPRDIKDTTSLHCASLAVARNMHTDFFGNIHLAQPSAFQNNGTLTFVETGGRVFGITCQHVVEFRRRLCVEGGSPHLYSLKTMLNGYKEVSDTFEQPLPDWPESAPDVAIRELEPDFVRSLEKKPIELDNAPEPPARIGHGLAVGFPEVLKGNRFDDKPGHRVAMPHTFVLAELAGFPMRRFTLASQMKREPSVVSYSGMSGGPIFWTSRDGYGIMGIIYEGGYGTDEMVYVYGELATPTVIKDWIGRYLLAQARRVA